MQKMYLDSQSVTFQRHNMMQKIILIGRSECGKTTLTQALSGKKIEYQKTQAVNHNDIMIDTPGEYIQTKMLGGAIALYSYESDIIGLLISATEPFSLYPPNITGQATREVIGIVTKIDHKDANPARAEKWLKLSGCKKIFHVSSYTGEGICELLDYLSKKQKKQQKTT